MKEPTRSNIYHGKLLNRDEIKYIAMLTMLLNHIANIFLEPGTALYTLFVNIGYFTAPVMCWFLVEGYYYTRSKKRYAARLALFTAISEIPFCLAFSEMFTGERVISFCGFNMIFTLLLCFCILLVREYVRNPAGRFALIFAVFLVSMFSDWALLAPAFTLLFDMARGDREKTKSAFLKAYALYALVNFYPGPGLTGLLTGLIRAALSASGVLLAGIAVLYLYNGKRGERGQRFSKWFFYLFYPVHLLILGVIRLCL